MAYLLVPLVICSPTFETVADDHTYKIYFKILDFSQGMAKHQMTKYQMPTQWPIKILSLMSDLSKLQSKSSYE